MKSLNTRQWVATGLGVIAAAILFFGGTIWDTLKSAAAPELVSRTNNVAAVGAESSAKLSASSTSSMQNISKTEGLEIYDIKEGEGAEAKAGKAILAHYVGTLTDGTKFDSSVDRGQPFEFTLGVGQVIQGWDLGIQGMKVGGVRKLVIAPELGYGARGAGNLIPPNSTLVFEVQLVAVEQ